MCKIAIQALFDEVYSGEILTIEAGHQIHRYCLEMGLNPTSEIPLAILVMTKEGRSRLGKYEEFIMNLNWLIAKLAAKLISTEKAIEQFFDGIISLKMESNHQRHISASEEHQTKEKSKFLFS